MLGLIKEILSKFHLKLSRDCSGMKFKSISDSESSFMCGAFEIAAISIPTSLDLLSEQF